MKGIFLVMASFMIMNSAYAGNVEIVNATAQQGNSGWRFDVTLKHEDSGWDHYADAWRIITEDGKELGTRTLLHPHENEQPFTRSLGNVALPSGVDHVYIEAHDKVHGWAKQRFRIELN